jgi:AraC-like DNA-binding protein
LNSTPITTPFRLAVARETCAEVAMRADRRCIPGISGVGEPSPSAAPRRVAAADPLEILEIADEGGAEGLARCLPNGDAGRPYLLILQRAGRSVVTRPPVRIALDTRDLLLVDTAVDAAVAVCGPSRQIRLRLPAPPAGRLPPIAVIHGTSGIAVALAGLLGSVHPEADRLTPAECAGVTAAVFELIQTALGGGGGDVAQRATASPPPPQTPAPLAPLQETIEHWLADPGLCPARVAAEHRMSTRQLHRLFRRAGTSFSDFVRHRRLQRCREDLADPRLRALPMTEIALRWGFNDSSHFSRSFRAAFGYTARDFRAGRATPGHGARDRFQVPS